MKAAQLQMLVRALEMVPVGVTITDTEGTILFVNSADASMHGYRTDELLGQNVRLFSTSRHWKVLSCDDLRSVSVWTRESINRKKDRSLFPVRLTSDSILDEAGNVVGIITICQDLTEQKVNDHIREDEAKRMKKLEHDALHDPLTGLTNRALFLDRLTVAFNRARRKKTHYFAVFFLDLDNFKVVNDSYGHLVGDQVIRTIAERLQACLRPSDTLGRLGGDEFGILLDDLMRTDDTAPIARRVLLEISRPMQVEEHQIHITASIGVAYPGPDLVNAEELLHYADLAMYEAKRMGKAQCVVEKRRDSASLDLQGVNEPRTSA